MSSQEVPLPGQLNLIKLSVGSESVDSLADWQAGRLAANGQLWHGTRMTPKRREELLNGGSIYWIIKGQIQARQRLVGIEQGHDAEGRRMTLLLLDPPLIRVHPTPHRPFQGWRYLQAKDAPRDLDQLVQSEDELPAALRNQLADMGLY
ncbi:DUF1489 family protein [Rhodovibrionaceae bacterium A322]